MADKICVIMVVSLIIGFILGRWRVKVYCGRVIVSADSETCTFSLDIPADDILKYPELTFRVVRSEENRDV